MKMKKPSSKTVWQRWSLGAALTIGLFLVTPPRYSEGQPPRQLLDNRDALDALMSTWEKNVNELIGKNAALKQLASKYPLVLLHSRLYVGGDYYKAAYSFVYETRNPKEHGNDVQLLFHNGGKPKTFCINMLNGQTNLVADLGKVDFTKDPDPKKVDLDFWDHGPMNEAIEGHVYLERVRDERGNWFYVLFKIVAVDKDSKYMAFIWRRLPGGRVVKRNDPKLIQ
jgi:hypothetical protein